jgi:hypothetical protein
VIEHLVAGVVVASAADCEAVGDGVLAQPVNALTSLAFVAGGAFVAGRTVRWAPEERWAGWVVAGGLAANGVGSLWYHAGPGELGHWVHDVAIVGLVAGMLVVDGAVVLRRPAREAVAWLVALVVAGGMLLAVAPGATNLVAGLLVAGLATAELVLGRQERRARRARRARWVVRLRDRVPVPEPVTRARWVLYASVPLAGLAGLLGRGRSPLCDPESLVQFHGLWHSLGALAVAAYVVGFVEPRLRAQRASQVRQGAPRRP